MTIVDSLIRQLIRHAILFTRHMLELDAAKIFNPLARFVV
jgi:hypothetical protein